MSPGTTIALADAILGSLRDVKDTRWSLVVGVSAGAYLFNFYADVYLYLSRPPGLIVFIGETALGI
jgi:hypothetical protein